MQTKLPIMGIMLLISVMIMAAEAKAADDTCTSHPEEGYITEQFDVSKYRTDKDADGYYTEYPTSERGSEWKFAGWYTDTDCTKALGNGITTGTYTAKFVPAHVLDVKAQVSANLLNIDTSDDSTASLRFVTSVDSHRYKLVGFKVDRPSKNETPTISASRYVYEELYAIGSTDSRLSYKPSDLFCAKSIRFKACVVNVPKKGFDTAVRAQSFWITKDGTYVPGAEKVISVNQAVAACIKYVSSSGNDTTGDGTIDNPYATVNKAVETVPDGGTVLLKDSVEMASTVSITKNVTIRNVQDKTITLTRADNFDGNMFQVDASANNVTFTLGSNEASATGKIIVNGWSHDSSNNARAISGRTVLNASTTSTFVLSKNAELTKAVSTSFGAAFANTGTAYLYGNMTQNNSTSRGAAINHASTKELHIYSGVYKGNVATKSNNDGFGGVIYSETQGGTIIIDDGTFEANTAEKGGVVYCAYHKATDYDLIINGGAFYNNKALANADSGGVLYLMNTKASITGGAFTNNTAEFRGGAIHCHSYAQASGYKGSILDITGGKFENNESRNHGGGAISVFESEVNITGSNVSMTGNTCLNVDTTKYIGGGAILIQGGSKITLNNCANITGNTTVGDGDTATSNGFDIGFRAQSDTELILKDNSFTGKIGWVYAEVEDSEETGDSGTTGDTGDTGNTGETEVPEVTVTIIDKLVQLEINHIYTVDYENKTLISTSAQ